MLKRIIPNTAIRIQKKAINTSTGSLVETWQDVLDEDIFCEWKNKFGAEVYKAQSINAIEPASIRLWFIPGIDSTCRIVRLEDGYEMDGENKVYNAVFEVINVDDVMNRHQQLEMEIKRYVEG